MYKIGYYGGQSEHKGYCRTHTHGGLHLLADTEEGTYAKELAQYDIVYEYRGNEYKYVCHVISSLVC